MSLLTVDSPLGPLTLREEGGRITALDWCAGGSRSAATGVLAEAARQLEAYFDRRLRQFSLPVEPRGSAFQQQVWAEMTRIPYGEVRRYGDLARTLGNPARAIGGACGSNPVPIIIPCHRVVAGDGLGGYSGGNGAATKQFLLALEGHLLL